jgi:hypothetical protein
MRAPLLPLVHSVLQGRIQTLGLLPAPRVYQAHIAQLVPLRLFYARLGSTAPHLLAWWLAPQQLFAPRVLQPPEPALLGLPALLLPVLAHQGPTLESIPWLTPWWVLLACGAVFQVNLEAAMPHQPRMPYP